jgi:hypothetical protein
VSGFGREADCSRAIAGGGACGGTEFGNSSGRYRSREAAVAAEPTVSDSVILGCGSSDSGCLGSSSLGSLTFASVTLDSAKFVSVSFRSPAVDAGGSTAGSIALVATAGGGETWLRSEDGP